MLELACGTGLWTRALATPAQRVTAVDAAPEMLALNRERLAAAGHTNVDYVQADLFSWRPQPASYDVCFFAFWLSHVPESRFAAFWEMVRSALRRGGRVFFIDSDRAERSTAADHRLPAAGEQTMQRRLNDGREFQIVKRFFDPRVLHERLAELGFEVEVRGTGEFFICGSGAPVR